MSRHWPRGSPSPPGGSDAVSLEVEADGSDVFVRGRVRGLRAPDVWAVRRGLPAARRGRRGRQLVPRPVAGRQRGAGRRRSRRWTSTTTIRLDLTRSSRPRPAGAADEAAVSERLPGPVSRVRRQPQRRDVRVRVAPARPAAGRPARPRRARCPTDRRDRERNSVMPLPKRRHSRARGRKRRTHYKLVGADTVGVSAVPGGQAAAPHLPALRLLQGARGHLRRSGVGSPAPSGDRGAPSRDRMKIAVDAMGGDHGPAVVVEGAVAAAREFGASRGARRRPGRHRARDQPPRRPEPRPRDPPRLRGGRHGREPLAGPAPQARLLAPGGRRAGPRRQGRRVHLGRQHRRGHGDLDVRHRRAAGHRPPGHRRGAAEPARLHGPARRRRQRRRPSPGTSSSSRSWATSTPRDILGLERPRVGLLSVGEEEGKGNDAHARGLRAAARSRR